MRIFGQDVRPDEIILRTRFQRAVFVGGSMLLMPAIVGLRIYARI